MLGEDGHAYMHTQFLAGDLSSWWWVWADGEGVAVATGPWMRCTKLEGSRVRFDGEEEGEESRGANASVLDELVWLYRTTEERKSCRRCKCLHHIRVSCLSMRHHFSGSLFLSDSRDSYGDDSIPSSFFSILALISLTKAFASSTSTPS